MPPPVNPLPAAIEGTRLESDEEIRQALQARRERLAAQAKKRQAAGPGKAPVATPAEVEAQAERPVVRPPTALLCVLDDGGTDGEWVRLRADVAIIGRTEGNVRIPHDAAISARHAELVRQLGPNGYRWSLVDLQSTNGTFVRVGSILLRNETEFILGSGRYRFEAGPPVPPMAGQPGAAPQSTQPWSGAVPVRSLVPSLVELSPAGPVSRFSLTLPVYWIGRDPRTCSIARPDDVLVSAKHARMYRDAKGWHIENNKSLNGLWLRVVEPMALASGCQLRVGEQRFVFRVT